MDNLQVAELILGSQPGDFVQYLIPTLASVLRAGFSPPGLQ